LIAVDVQTALESGGGGRVFSLHIDTAKTWRGGQSQVMYTVLGLRRLEQRAVLVAHPQGELYRRLSEGIDLIPLASRNEIDLAAAWRLARVLKRSPPDLIQAHDPHAVAMAALALAISAPSPRPPLLATRRIEYPIGRNSFSRWKYSQVERFIAISGAVRDRLVADGIAPLRISVVHEGVDVERIERQAAASVHAAFFLPTHAPIVGNIGALTAQKGQHDLIEAAALVVREVPDARFVILGAGELREALEQQIHRKHLERHVILGGFRTDAMALLKGFDVFALSSTHEGMCTSLVDAMAASKAAVATAVGGVPEVLADGQTGFLVPPHNPPALAEKIVRLLKDDGLRARFAAAALARARAHFTVERMVDETLAVYRLQTSGP
jgi:glycosyltransferase involved in cell wall biosynthesis